MDALLINASYFLKKSFFDFILIN